MSNHESLKDIVSHIQSEGRLPTLEETLQMGLIPAQWIYDLITSSRGPQELFDNLQIARELRLRNRQRFLELSQYDFWPKKNHK